jgi:pimeloyl-ACP methyl ester carboxylesterase
MRTIAVVLAALAAASAASARPAPADPMGAVRLVDVRYRAHDGYSRNAWLMLPSWYGPMRHPRIPLVIAPHGRGVTALDNTRLWGDLPARGPFAVVNPEGQGRKLTLYSWGDPGQIGDLARMPAILRRAVPWLRIGRIYAVGGSMGGQETLLLLARHPHLLAGAISFDAPVDMASRFRQFPESIGGSRLQELAVQEIGGTPARDPRAWAARSPLLDVRGIAASGVPLQLWWSTRDRIVVDQEGQSGLLYREIERLNPDAPVTQVVGTWRHTAEMHWNRRLPYALAQLGLLPRLAAV